MGDLRFSRDPVTWQRGRELGFEFLRSGCKFSMSSVPSFCLYIVTWGGGIQNKQTKWYACDGANQGKLGRNESQRPGWTRDGSQGPSKLGQTTRILVWGWTRTLHFGETMFKSLVWNAFFILVTAVLFSGEGEAFLYSRWPGWVA